MNYVAKPKPIKKERLEKAIAKLGLEKTKTKRSDFPVQQVFVRDGEKCWFVKMSDIRIGRKLF